MNSKLFLVALVMMLVGIVVVESATFSSGQKELVAIDKILATLREKARKFMEGSCRYNSEAGRSVSLALAGWDLPLEQVKAAIRDRMSQPEVGPNLPSMNKVFAKAYASVLTQSARLMDKLAAFDSRAGCNFATYLGSEKATPSNFISNRYLMYIDLQ